MNIADIIVPGNRDNKGYYRSLQYLY